MNKKPAPLHIDIYLDIANKEQMLKAHKEKIVTGFTTNPTLMAKAGIKDYLGFCREVLAEIKSEPISFEVFADDFAEMKRQAAIIATLGTNVFVKIPIMNTKRQSAVPLVKELFAQGMKLNITAIFSKAQLEELRAVMKPQDKALISIFAGRIADAGVDPMPLMKEAVAMFKHLSGSQILWASCREPLNVYQANDCGCHVITVPPDIVTKLSFYGKNPEEFSWETVKTFFEDGQKAGFSL